MSLHEAAYRVAEPAWRVDVRAPATARALDGVEKRLGRLLPDEARQLYRWHDGAGWIVPDLSFNSLEVAYAQYLAGRLFGLTKLTNAPGTVDGGTLFPVFNIDGISFNALTTTGRRAKTSPLYVPLFDDSVEVTMVAHRIRDLIDHLIKELEAGNVNHTAHGVRWTRDPYGFDPAMEPYGALPNSGA